MPSLVAEARRTPVASTSGQRWRWAALARTAEVVCLTRPIWASPRRQSQCRLRAQLRRRRRRTAPRPWPQCQHTHQLLHGGEALTALVATACRGGADPDAFPFALMMPNGGRITLYKNGIYECKCPNQAAHGALCRLTRTRKAAAGAAKKTNALQGRPLGLMAAWCHAAFDGSCRTHAEHMTHQPDREARRDGRQRLKHLGVPGLTLLSTERRRAADEPEEPDFIL